MNCERTLDDLRADPINANAQAEAEALSVHPDLERIAEDQRRINAEAIARGAAENPMNEPTRLRPREERCSPSIAEAEVQQVRRRDSRRALHEFEHWPTPTSLPEGLPPVDPFDDELLPPLMRQYVADIAERIQCPPDFPAVALMTVISSVVGRRCGIRPKRLDDWTVVPNLWGMVIGKPGIMKTPPLQEVMRPLQELQAQAIQQFDSEVARYVAGSVLAEEAQRVNKGRIRKLLQDDKHAEALERAEQMIGAGAREPTCRRYIINDATVEKLGEILNQNPSGLLLFRDELTAFFRTLDRQGHEADRAFYLECWNGDGSHTYDRIGRGTLHIQGACLAILGGIQPGPLTDLVRGLRGSSDDGLLQRFQLAVWPDVERAWKNVDRLPDQQARGLIHALMQQLDGMSIDPKGIPVLRFDEPAQLLFDTWRERLEARLRDDGEHPAIETQLAKYRSLVPSLALLLHLAEHFNGPVQLIALERAIAWTEYLESHARRIYAPAISPDVDAARLLAAKVTRGDIPERFALRDIYRQGWSGLSSVESATAAVSVLEDFGWLRANQEQTPGRRRTVYSVNPACLPREPTT